MHFCMQIHVQYMYVLLMSLCSFCNILNFIVFFISNNTARPPGYYILQNRRMRAFNIHKLCQKNVHFSDDMLVAGGFSI